MGLKDMQEEINELKKVINSNKVKEVKYRYPFGKKVSNSQRKKNYVTVHIINENSIIDSKKYQIIDQTIMHELVPRLATAGHVLHDKKGNPVIILPSWSVEPFSPLVHYNKSMIDGSNTKGYKILMARMEAEKSDGKKKMPKILPWVIGGILVAIILYAVLTGGSA